MSHETYEFIIEAEDQGTAARGARELTDALREAGGVIEVGRRRANETTMDLGAIVSVIATSGATLAIARGIAQWLRVRRGPSITIERDRNSGSIKTAVNGIDPEAAVRIAEIVRG